MEIKTSFIGYANAMELNAMNDTIDTIYDVILFEWTAL